MQPMSLVNQAAISRAAKHRLKIILRMRKDGKSMDEIGRTLEISKQRVCQILQRANRGG